MKPSNLLMICADPPAWEILIVYCACCDASIRIMEVAESTSSQYREQLSCKWKKKGVRRAVNRADVSTDREATHRAWAMNLSKLHSCFREMVCTERMM